MVKKEAKNKKLEHRLTKVETGHDLLVKDMSDKYLLLRGDITKLTGRLDNHITKIYTTLDEIKKQLYSRPSWMMTGGFK